MPAVSSSLRRPLNLSNLDRRGVPKACKSRGQFWQRRLAYKLGAKLGQPLPKVNNLMQAQTLTNRLMLALREKAQARDAWCFL